MQKRGQVTIFLIIGIVILAIFALVFYITSNIQKESLAYEQDRIVGFSSGLAVKNYVQNCIKEIAVPGIYLLGLQGGIIYPDDTNSIFLTEDILINYGYLNGVDRFSSEKMEMDLAKFIEDSLPSCLNNFNIFTKQGINVKEKSGINVNTKINLDFVSINLDYDLEVNLDGEVAELNKFSSQIEIPLGKIVKDAKTIVSRTEQNELINFDYLTESEAFVSIIPMDEETLVYSLNYENIIYNDAPYIFFFAISNNELNELSKLNTAPKLDYIPDLVLKKGDQFILKLNAKDIENDKLTFFSNSLEFPVNQNGLIDIVPQNSGTYFVTFTVAEEKLKSLHDSQKVRVVVE